MFELLCWQWRRQLRHTSTSLVLLLQFAAFAITLSLLWHKFANAQAAHIQNLSLSHDVLTPLYGLIAFLIVFSAPVHALPAWSSARQAQTFIWWQQSNLAWPLVLTRWLSSVGSQLLFVLPASIALLNFAGAVAIDLNQWLSVLIANLILLCAVQAITLLISSFFAQLFTNLLLSYALLALWIAIDLLPGRFGVFGAWSPAREGVLALNGLCYFVALLCAALMATRQLWWSGTRAMWPWLLPIILLALSSLSLPQFHLLATPTAQINEDLQQWLRQQNEPVTLTVIASDPELRDDFQQQLQLLIRYHPQLNLKAIHPSQIEPSLREQIPQNNGLLIQTLQRNDWLTLPQPHLTSGVIVRLQHLTQLSQAWLVFSEGHGERKIFSDENRDIGQWSTALKQNGYTLAPFAWQIPTLPGNTRVLVIAHLQTAMLPAEQKAVLDYVEQGGHLLWLRDPDDVAWPELENRLGVTKLAGTVLDPDGVKRGTPHPAIALVDRYAAHDSVQQSSALSALPWAAALQIMPSDFSATPLLFSSAHVVLQTGEQLDQINSHLPASQHILGVALSREVNQRAQRIIVVGDSHFAANTAIGNYGNQALALNLVRWLALADDAPPLPELNAADAVFLPTAWQTFNLRWCWPVVLPLLLVLWLARQQWRWRQHS